MKANAGALGPTLTSLGHQYPALAAKRAGSELFGAPRLNAFSLFQPNEVQLSRIIADLFDPSGAHGQGLLFLNAMLSELGLERVSAIDSVSVRREMVTKDKRQIDLVIGMPNIILGIENKPWAGQQPDQLSDYFEALERWAKRGRTKKRTPVLVFLSNKQPKTAADRIRQLWFNSDDNDEPSLTKLLENCREKVRAPRTRTHVDEMITYLSSEFGDDSMKPMSTLLKWNSSATLRTNARLR